MLSLAKIKSKHDALKRDQSIVNWVHFGIRHRYPILRDVFKLPLCFHHLGEMLADSTVTVSGGSPPFFMPPPTSVAGSAAAAAAATRALIMNPAAYLAAGAAAAPFLYGNNALRYGLCVNCSNSHLAGSKTY